MSDMNDPKSGALEPIRTEALDTVRPPAQQLRWNARATHRAMQGWQRVQSHEDWERINEESGEQYESGAFLLERLGADRFLDPRLMATILALRQRLIAESGITTAAETMLVDQAVLSYYHTLRVQGWIGDLAVRIEHEFFGDDAFTEMARKGHRRADRFAVEDRVRQLSEQLMSLSDRANRMMIRNLKAIKELRQGQVPAVAIGRADQVTVTSRPGRRLRAVKTELPSCLQEAVAGMPAPDHDRNSGVSEDENRIEMAVWSFAWRAADRPANGCWSSLPQSGAAAALDKAHDCRRFPP
jgi:hypothetical protein